MDEKLRFVFSYERDEESTKALCERFGISRQTGYVWIRRYRRSGLEGLAEVNRAPLRHPNQTPVSIEAAVLDLRQAHMTWGPRNRPSDEDLSPGTPELKRIPERDQPWRGWPAANILSTSLGLSLSPYRRRRHAARRRSSDGWRVWE